MKRRKETLRESKKRIAKEVYEGMNADERWLWDNTDVDELVKSGIIVRDYRAGEDISHIFDNSDINWITT